MTLKDNVKNLNFLYINLKFFDTNTLNIQDKLQILVVL